MKDLCIMAEELRECKTLTCKEDYLLKQGRVQHIESESGLSWALSKEEPERFERICQEVKIPSYLKLNHECLGAYLLQRRNDDSVEIVCQNTQDGVKFDSFYKALRQNIDTRASLMNFLVEDDSNSIVEEDGSDARN